MFSMLKVSVLNGLLSPLGPLHMDLTREIIGRIWLAITGGRTHTVILYPHPHPHPPMHLQLTARGIASTAMMIEQMFSPLTSPPCCS